VASSYPWRSLLACRVILFLPQRNAEKYTFNSQNGYGRILLKKAFKLYDDFSLVEYAIHERVDFFFKECQRHETLKISSETK